MAESVKEGGCLCGAIRYEADGPLSKFGAALCHCRDCQKATGAPLAAWMDFPAASVRWLTTRPKEYASSEFIRRGFCDTCGTTLSYRHVDYPQYLGLAIGSLDDPNLVQPRCHEYTRSQVDWLTIEDDRKRFVDGPIAGEI